MATDFTSSLPSIPGGYVLGRTDSGSGTVQLISLADLAAAVLSTKGRVLPIGFSWPGGVPGNSQVIGHHSFSIGVTFPPNFSAYNLHASQAGGSAATTASTVFTVAKSTVGTGSWTTIGTVTFAISTVTPTFATVSSAAQFLPAGDVLRIIGPASADATFADPFFTLIGYES